MSRALDYLLNARPEAMGAYFAFLKDAGSRLDPKTRALISVITKVSAQTEKGLVQYTRRALGVGCSAEEILDAMLMAFPALGLSRIVWAVEVLLEAGVEGFADLADQGDLAELSRADATSEVIELASLPPQRIHKIQRPGRSMLLYRSGETVRAFKAYCSHQGMELMDDGIAGHTITCRQHGWRFEMPDGRCPRGAGWGLAELPVTIVDGVVSVQWPD